MAVAEEGTDLATLAGYLNALANPTRLEILAKLRTPRTLAEIEVRPGRAEEGTNPDRSISRNAVARHLLLLRSIGVVASRAGTRDGREVEEFVLNHARLFQILEELRALTNLRPVDVAALDVTAADGRARAALLPAGPHVVVLTGPNEGRAYALAGAGPWRIGRVAPADVVLDHDLYVSSEHALLEREGADFAVRDVERNRNGTLLNWTRLPRGGRALLAPGDVIRVGRTLLAFRRPPTP